MDSTTRYEFNDYSKSLTHSQLAAPSPYNTRLNRGLPPTPISNPGEAAIQAAAHPPHTNYLYFVVKPCGNGASVFTSNYNKFLADSDRYQKARRAKGNEAMRAGASVFSATTSPEGSKSSVLAAPIDRAASDALSARTSAACLCGIVTLTPRKPAPGKARTVSEKRSGGIGSSW